jgi:GST-like protein
LRFPERQGVDIEEYPNVKRWREAILARPAVQRGLTLLADRRQAAPLDPKSRDVLFGATQYQRR